MVHALAFITLDDLAGSKARLERDIGITDTRGVVDSHLSAHATDVPDFNPHSKKWAEGSVNKKVGYGYVNLQRPQV